MGKSVLIIGAGISGLATGCYAQMNGYDSMIFEMHDKPGGLCTSWRRKGYTIDGCIHYLTGTSPNSGYYKIWQELGTIQGRKIVNHSEFLRVEGSEGKELVLYSDINRLEQHLKELSPQDEELITDLIGIVRKMAKFNPPINRASEVRGKFEGWMNYLKAFPLLYSLKKYGKMTIGEFANLFKDKFLRETFPLLFFGLNDFPVMALMGFIGYFSIGNCGYPVEGSLSFARSMEHRYKNLGGTVHYSARVESIITENGRTVGVVLSDSSEYRGDYIISAADGRWTIFDLLEGKYVNDEILCYYNKLPVYPPCVYITLGVSANLSTYPHGAYYQLNEPFMLAGVLQQWLGIQHYSYDPTLATEGKSIVNVMILTEYAYWKSLYENYTEYREEKKRIADVVISEVQKRYAVTRDQVEVIDVATPVTYERYTGNWQGSFMGWKPDVNVPRKLKRKTLPGLTGFYMAGQWVEYTGGIPAAAKSGRDVVQIICKADNKAFSTSIG